MSEKIRTVCCEVCFFLCLAHGVLSFLTLAQIEKKNNNPHTQVHLSERLASFSIFGARMRAPVNPLGSSHNYLLEGFKGGPQLGPIMPTDASLSDSGCKFSALLFPNEYGLAYPGNMNGRESSDCSLKIPANFTTLFLM